MSDEEKEKPVITNIDQTQVAEIVQMVRKEVSKQEKKDADAGEAAPALEVKGALPAEPALEAADAPADAAAKPTPEELEAAKTAVAVAKTALEATPDDETAKAALTEAETNLANIESKMKGGRRRSTRRRHKKSSKKSRRQSKKGGKKHRKRTSKKGGKGKKRSQRKH